MAVCASCGASTSARRCPRCGGETTPFAAPRPEAARPAAANPPAGTTVSLPRIASGSQPVVGSGDETVTLPVAGARPTGPQAGQPHMAPAGSFAAAPPPGRPAPSAPTGGAAGPAPTRPAPAAPAGAAPPPPGRAQSPFSGRTGAVVAALVAALLVASAVIWFLMSRPGGIATVRPARPVQVNLPAGARACAETDAPHSGLQVFAGNDKTSCGLAENARLKLGDLRGSATIDVWSDRTNRSYRLTCTGQDNISCSGGSGAVVYLVPRTSRVVIAK